MEALRTIYDEIPDVIEIPKNIRHKRAEVIIITLENDEKIEKTPIDKLYGIIPDFPERFEQGNFQNRDEL